MALNWTMLRTDRAPVPLPNEMTVTTIETVVEVSLTIPDAPSAGALPSGCSGGVKKLKGYGKLYLTDQRVRRFPFLSRSNITKDPLWLIENLQFLFVSDSKTFESLSVPLHAILSTRFEQPTFGTNFLSFEVKPAPNGGLTEGTKVEVRFKDRAMFEFVSLLEKSRERAIYMRREVMEHDDDDGLRAYDPSVWYSLACCHAQLHPSSIVYYAWWIKFRINGWWCPCW
jgi:hypothetical protein